MRATRGRAPTALALAAGSTVVERSGGGAPDTGRLAVLAHWSATPRVSLSLRTLVAELRALDYRVVVVSSATCPEPLDWSGDDLGSTAVIRKPNVGYDFGSWAVGLAHVGQAAHVGQVVLANDSLVGPFASIEPLLDRFHASPADVWGLTETLQFTRHLQSYFLGFHHGVLGDRPLTRFWRHVRHYEDKNLVIHRNELGLGRLLHREGYSVDAAFVAGQVVDPADNPTIAGWRTLLDRGMPFVKRELVRSPELVPDGHRIPAEVLTRYGAAVGEWL